LIQQRYGEAQHLIDENSNVVLLRMSSSDLLIISAPKITLRAAPPHISLSAMEIVSRNRLSQSGSDLGTVIALVKA
jgi:hypothetical protein